FALFGLILNSVLDLFVETTNYIFKINNETVSNIIFLSFEAFLFVVFLIINARNKMDFSIDILENVPVIIYIVIFISALSTYYTMMLPKNNEFTQNNSYFLLIGSVFLVIGCMIFMILKYISMIQVQKTVQLQIDSQLTQYEELLNKNHEIKRFKHDYKNNMYALSSLINDGKVDDAKAFIAEMNMSIENTEITFATGNYLADAIISHKALVAKQNDIEINFDGTIPASGITNNDLCTVLSNALDNAIEGSVKCSPCSINIKSFESRDGFIIEIKNPVNKQINIKDNKITSSKRSKKNHGFGIENIKTVAERNNGFVKLECKNNIFIIKIALMFKNEELLK
ncbi:MAG: GHKL domain-containing protein, partial [Ruminococcus sp.]|nr:GHKL domain-containing protein [Candidatus Copronaster equi]